MSEIRANTVSNAAGTGAATLTGQYAAKVWVNFNGQGTLAIRASGNVSSITDNGTADYTVNFTTAMPDANYAAVGSGGQSGNTDAVGVQCPTTVSTGSYRFGVVNSSGTLSDRDTIFITVTR